MNSIKSNGNTSGSERHTSWSGDDDQIKERIERSDFVKNIRSKLKKRRLDQN